MEGNRTGTQANLEGRLGRRSLRYLSQGLLGVLRMKALVRDVNLLASSVGSSCQLLLESEALPFWMGLREEREAGWQCLLLDFHL